MYTYICTYIHVYDEKAESSFTRLPVGLLRVGPGGWAWPGMPGQPGRPGLTGRLPPPTAPPSSPLIPMSSIKIGDPFRDETDFRNPLGSKIRTV